MIPNNHQVITKEEWVTPDRAMELITKLHPNQRVLRNNNVNKYARLMTENKWELSYGSAIVISKNGVLLNGYHRLSAVILANKPVQFVIHYGADNDEFAVIDTGQRRTNADALGLKPYITEPLNFLHRFIHGQNSPTAQDIAPLIDTPIGEAVRFVGEHQPGNRTGKTTASFRAAVACCVLRRESKKYEIVHQYRSFCTDDYDNMSDRVKDLNRRLSQRGTKALRNYAPLYAGLVAFDPESKRTQISPQDCGVTNPLIQEYRRFLEKILEIE